MIHMYAGVPNWGGGLQPPPPLNFAEFGAPVCMSRSNKRFAIL